MTLLCRLGIHAKVHVNERSRFRNDLYRCRRCPAQWRIGSYGYHWGSVHYRERIEDASGPSVREADAHAWQEYNAHGNTCHYPGCRLTEDEHESANGEEPV